MNETGGLDLGQILQTSGSILVTDSVQAEGRFVLCQLALTEQQQPVLWMCCSNQLNDKRTEAALKKLGLKHDACLPDRATSAIPQTEKSTSDVVIRSIPTVMEKQIMQSPDAQFDQDVVAKYLLSETKSWCAKHDCVPRVVLDDVSALSSFLGERCAYRFVHSLLRLDCQLVIRCSNDLERPTDAPETFSEGRLAAVGTERLPWENSLVELFDQTLDVLPLESGYSREAHGRLIVTDATSSSLYNFTIYDTTVKVIATDQQAKTSQRCVLNA